MAAQQQRDRIEHETFIAYQTVRVWALTKGKKGHMPKFQSLLPSRDNGTQSVEQMRMTMQMLANQYGPKRMKVATTNHGE